MAEFHISDIQHFSVGDGPGIRTTVFCKGCSLHCPWCHNPETISPVPETLTFSPSGKTVRYGRSMSVEAVAREVLEDIDFYRESGGGVTLSGGEPLLQHTVIAELGKILQSREASLLIDTAGCVAWTAIEAVLPYADMFYFDWKTADPAYMRDKLGGDYVRVRENLSRLLAAGVDVHVRIPLIPGVNVELAAPTDTPDPLTAGMIASLREVGAQRVDLLPFHRLGAGKYAAMGKPYAFADTLPPTRLEVDAVAAHYRRHFDVSIEI